MGRKRKSLTLNQTEISRFIQEYDYCDTMPLIAWAWEFGRRSDACRNYWTAYHAILDSCRSSKDFVPFFSQVFDHGPFKIHYLDTVDPSVRWNDDMAPLASSSCGLSPAVPVVTYNLVFADSNTLGLHDLVREGIEHPLNIASDYSSNQWIVMALVDISSPRSVDELMEPIKASIIQWRTALGFKKRAQKKQKKIREDISGYSSLYKSYLMIYDFKIKYGCSFVDISEYFTRAGLSYDEKRISYYYKQACRLVNGGYKDLIRK